MGALVVFHIQDGMGNARPGIKVQATSPVGDWSSYTDAAGNVVDPDPEKLIAGVTLGEGDYHLEFPGYDPPLDAHIKDCGQIKHAILPKGGGGGGGVLPPRPTRDQMCGVRNQLQGISVGNHHLFDPEIGWSSNKSFRMEAYDGHRAVGDTHVCLSLDMTGLECLPRIKDVIREAITDGGMVGVMLMCMGDGNDEGEHDHDPGALNFSWLMSNFNAIVDFMEFANGEDLTPWINFGPGFDGVIPAWQPFTRVNEFVRMARARLNQLTWGPGYLNVELAGGFPSWSGERNDWATADGQMIDTILQEFPIEWGPPTPPPANLLTPDGRDWSLSATNEQRNPWTQIWIVQRMLGPLYKRPAMQPANYDPHPPYFLGGGTPRGRFFYICWERTTYLWTRKNCDLSVVAMQTKVIADLGAEFY
jgi:hypothetical protein